VGREAKKAPEDGLGEALDRLRATVDVDTRRAADPVAFVHRYPDAADAEIAGLVAAALAFGNVVALRRSVADALGRLGPHDGRQRRFRCRRRRHWSRTRGS